MVLEHVRHAYLSENHDRGVSYWRAKKKIDSSVGMDFQMNDSPKTGK